MDSGAIGPLRPVIARLAPTPSGYLHLGNAVNFVLTWLLTRRAGGTLHLRIDDLDRARLRRPYLDNIFRVIDWLQIDYDQGPRGPDDFLRHHSQLLHLPDYNAVLRRLAQQPGLVQASHRSRTSGPDAPVPLETPGATWRARVPPGTVGRWPDAGQGPAQVMLAREMPDFVIRKKDGVAAYQVASVVDDLRLGTTLIVRGLDLRASTAAQLWLATQLSETAAFRCGAHPVLPPRFADRCGGAKTLQIAAGAPGHRRAGAGAERRVCRRGAAAEVASRRRRNPGHAAPGVAGYRISFLNSSAQ